MLYLLMVLNVVAFGAIVWVLIGKYRATRDNGLLWLACAVLIWPLLGGVLQGGERLLVDRMAAGQSIGIFPFSLVERHVLTVGSLMASLGYARNLVGLLLVLVGFSKLHKHAQQVSQSVPEN